MARDNATYPARYGEWAGKPDGVPPDYERCCETVHGDGGFRILPHQCTKRRGYGPGEAYCKQHDPEAAMARRLASDERSRVAWNRQRINFHGATFKRALEQIAAGHNDARALASEVLAEFHEGDH